jgi:hypothetical protein
VLIKNADGEGLTLEQVAKRTAQSTLAYGRAGLLTDYPTTDGPVTVEEMKTQNLQPIIKHYYPWQIRNWATIQRGAMRVLSLVVLEEITLEQVDDFALAETVSYRVLKLDPVTFNYSVEVWGQENAATAAAKNGAATDKFVVKSAYSPRDSEGNSFKEIPFTFVGAEANDVWCDRPPLYDLA